MCYHRYKSHTGCLAAPIKDGSELQLTPLPTTRIVLGIHHIEDHSHPVSFDQGIESDVTVDVVGDPAGGERVDVVAGWNGDTNPTGGGMMSAK
ncbi:hypothetical protein OSB04_020977 [Centaurea solstitialis]|uniref:Uncharacterized protein n=1 Tax=Centaurea solstitialis TaxID=347529 RepID=A0AA38WFT7_9ASTR|nr:hypothetical protein OSB04_020977 [Centaurea solstitialis]